MVELQGLTSLSGSWRNRHPVLCSSCRVLQPVAVSAGSSFPASSSPWLSFQSSMTVILVDRERYLFAVDLRSLNGPVEHPSMCSLVICISPFEKCLFKYFCHFSMGFLDV